MVCHMIASHCLSMEKKNDSEELQKKTSDSEELIKSMLCDDLVFPVFPMREHHFLLFEKKSIWRKNDIEFYQLYSPSQPTGFICEFALITFLTSEGCF